MANSWRRVVPVVFAEVFGLLIIGAGFGLWPIFNNIKRNDLQTTFKTSLPILKNSSTVSAWENPSEVNDMYMKVYFFDIQNPEDVFKGGKPSVIERGPYTYQETRFKLDVWYKKDKSSVTYIQPRILTFNRSLSAGEESDIFTTINLPLVSMLSALRSLPVAEEVLNAVLRAGVLKDESPLITLNASQIMWGYEDPLTSRIKTLLKLWNITLPLPDVYGFMHKKNGAADGEYIVKTGKDDLDLIMQIVQWQHSSSLPYWKSTYCNMINGTDGSRFQPYINSSSTLAVFSSDIVRSYEIAYHSQNSIQQIQTYRYKPWPTLFAYPPDNLDNMCFCLGNGSCPHNGVLDISATQNGVPVFASQPHFLYGDYYKSAIDGLQPDEDRHSSYTDVEPFTGVVLQRATRLQMNLLVENNPYVANMSLIYSGMYPMLWYEELSSHNSKGMEDFKEIYFNILATVSVIGYVLIGVGGAFVLLTTAIYIIFRYKRRTISEVNEYSINSERTPVLGEGTTPTSPPTLHVEDLDD